MEVTVKNIVKNFKEKRVLDHVNLEFYSQRVYGLRGKNGAGKTMLLRSLCGLILLDEGEIKINGRSLGKDYSFPEDVGILIEGPGYIEEFSGFDNLKYIADIKKKIGDKEIHEIMTYFDLDPEDQRSVKKYSLGMKQKLGLCMAFMERPNLILLDEPLNALDEQAAKKLLELILQRKQEGALIIIASHDREELDYLSDEIIFMKEGRIVSDEKEISIY
ncbi:ABC transporter ATP-binding protein [Gallicola sp. Sow4_E12]|uniref:ABC transporter ATP-binding protein n=1 Tax=Gallicola sp. Sow4_E12 TaxID=3438785 RepID=UPI003F909A54